MIDGFLLSEHKISLYFNPLPAEFLKLTSLYLSFFGKVHYHF